MKHVLAIILLFNLLIPTGFADNHLISKQEAVSIAQKDHPGRVLSVKQKNGQYRIKIIDKQGKVRMISVDATKGQQKKD